MHGKMDACMDHFLQLREIAVCSLEVSKLENTETARRDSDLVGLEHGLGISL